MPNANWSNPTLTSTYTNFVTEVKNRDEDLALQFDGTTSTNLVTNTIRWDSSANRWKKWNGSSWAELTATYALTALSTTGAITGSSTVSGTALIPTAATVPTNGVFLPAANTVGLATGSTERLRVTSTGTALLGTQTALTNAYAIGTVLTPAVQIEANTGNGAALSITRQTSAAANLLLQRGVTGTPVVDTDAVGQINFNGFDGANYFNAALVRAVVDGTPGTGSMPGRLSLQTTPTGSTTPVERLRVDSAGDITIAGGGAIKADFSNATVASRTYFQASTTNGATTVGAIPNGTGVSSAFFAFNNSTPTNASYVGVVVSSTTTNIRSAITGTGTYLPLLFETNNQEQARFTTTDRYFRMAASTGGVQFNGDTAAANALDDYEEGTFTPTIIGVTTPGAGTYSVQTGRYTKVGRTVQIQLRLVWSAHTGTGVMRIGALPFTIVNATAHAAVAIRISNITSPASTIIQMYALANTTDLIFESVPVAGGAAANLAIDTAGDVTVGIVYEAA